MISVIVCHVSWLDEFLAFYKKRKKWCSVFFWWSQNSRLILHQTSRQYRHPARLCTVGWITAIFCQLLSYFLHALLICYIETLVAIKACGLFEFSRKNVIFRTPIRVWPVSSIWIFPPKRRPLIFLNLRAKIHHFLNQ